MLKVIAACGSGMGSSQIIKMKIEKVFKKLGIPVEIHHSSISEAKSLASQYNVVFCSEALKNNFSSAAEKGVIIIGLKNLLDEKEMEAKVVDQIVNTA